MFTGSRAPVLVGSPGPRDEVSRVHHHGIQGVAKWGPPTRVGPPDALVNGMAIIEGLLGRFGYVKLERYGLLLTPDGQVVSLQPAALDEVTVAPPPARNIEWPAAVAAGPVPLPDLVAVTPARVALAAVEATHFGPTTPPTPTPSVDEDQDEWEWHMALARARAAAADAETPAEEAPPAPVAKPTPPAKPAPVRMPIKRPPTPAPIVSMPTRTAPVIPVPTLPTAAAAKVAPPPMPPRRAARGTPSPSVRAMPLPPGEDTTRVEAAPAAGHDEEITRTEVKPAPLPRFSQRFAAVR